MTFDVFLSYNSQDKPAVRALAAALQARGLRAWLDEDELPPGLPHQPLLERAIREARSVAVCVGASGIGPWQNEEMQAALALAVRDGRPVIPTLLPGAPGAPDLPLFLANRTWVDLRPQMTEAGLDRLEWGITGIKPGARPAGGVPTPPPKDSPALAIWREKLEYFLEQEAIASDPALKFNLAKHIEEARRKIRELEA